MNAFIVRPFGEKNGINFERVEAELIRPALKMLDIPGGTTGPLAYAGNIRTDMFEQLLLADVVVADISIHNANVFYELGIRHALRDKRTFLIRCKGDEVPFDLKTDRYLEYDKDKPGDTLPQLVEGLRQTLKSDRRDSPVFLLLPDLEPPRREAFLIVPEGFGLEVEKARERRRAGDLALLAAEARGFQWEIEGLRVVGRTQFRLKANDAARDTWEGVLEHDPDDLEANLLLGTIYQRLGEFAASDRSVRKALESEPSPTKRAEANALLGSNAKTLWKTGWATSATPAEAALQSNYLTESYEHYARGFCEDQNHYYSGLNALGLLTVRLELARMLPEVWDAQFDNSNKAKDELVTLEAERVKLAAAVEHSIESARKRLERVGQHDIWLDFSKADFRCLTVESPVRVAAIYRGVVSRAEPFDVDAARRQLEMYQTLGVLRESVEAALSVLPPSIDGKKEAQLQVLLFTGHQIDSKERDQPRFPQEKVEVARRRIKEEIERVLRGREDAPKLGIAGAASGGDILFHEVCAELGIPTHVYLALPDNMFINESVAPADADWVERFRRLLKSKDRDREVRQLADSKEMPKWLQVGKSEYDIWQRNNLWLLHNALALGGKHTTLIALWDGKGGDGPGGTQNMVEQARAHGAFTVVINSEKEFGL